MLWSRSFFGGTVGFACRLFFCRGFRLAWRLFCTGYGLGGLRGEDEATTRFIVHVRRRFVFLLGHEGLLCGDDVRAKHEGQVNFPRTRCECPADLFRPPLSPPRCAYLVGRGADGREMCPAKSSEVSDREILEYLMPTCGGPVRWRCFEPFGPPPKPTFRFLGRQGGRPTDPAPPAGTSGRLRPLPGDASGRSLPAAAPRKLAKSAYWTMAGFWVRVGFGGGPNGGWAGSLNASAPGNGARRASGVREASARRDI